MPTRKLPPDDTLRQLAADVDDGLITVADIASYYGVSRARVYAKLNQLRGPAHPEPVDGWLTSAEAADVLDRPLWQVQEWLANGVLRGIKVILDGRPAYQIYPSYVDDLKNRLEAGEDVNAGTVTIMKIFMSQEAADRVYATLTPAERGQVLAEAAEKKELVNIERILEE